MKFPLIICLSIGLGGAASAKSNSSDAAFVLLVHGFTDAYLRLPPEQASWLGDHRYDGRLSEFGPAALAEREVSLSRYAGLA